MPLHVFNIYCWCVLEKQLMVILSAVGKKTNVRMHK
jgi:hypothetical protein